MSVTFQQMVSTRQSADGIDVTTTAHFAGEGVTLDDVRELFVAGVQQSSAARGHQAAAQMTAAHASREQTMRAAIVEALDKVSPEERAELVRRYDLAAEGL